MAYTAKFAARMTELGITDAQNVSITEIEPWRVHNFIQIFGYDLKKEKKVLLMIDARTPEEFNKVSIARSINMTDATGVTQQCDELNLDDMLKKTTVIIFDGTSDNSSESLVRVAAEFRKHKNWVQAVHVIKGGFPAMQALPFTLTSSPGYNKQQKMMLSLPTFGLGPNVLIGNFFHVSNRAALALLGELAGVVDVTPFGVAAVLKPENQQDQPEEGTVLPSVTDEEFAAKMGFPRERYLHLALHQKPLADDCTRAIHLASEAVDEFSKLTPGKPVLIFDSGSGVAVATLGYRKAMQPPTGAAAMLGGSSAGLTGEMALMFALKCVPEGLNVSSPVMGGLLEAVGMVRRGQKPYSMYTMTEEGDDSKLVPDAIANLQKALQEALGATVQVFQPKNGPKKIEEIDEDAEDTEDEEEAQV